MTTRQTAVPMPPPSRAQREGNPRPGGSLVPHVDTDMTECAGDGMSVEGPHRHLCQCLNYDCGYEDPQELELCTVCMRIQESLGLPGKVGGLFPHVVELCRVHMGSPADTNKNWNEVGGLYPGFSIL